MALHEQKGFAIDDSTLSECIDKVGIIPHSADELPTITLRMFTGWKHQFDESKRKDTWNKLKSYVDKTNAKILFGVEYNKDYDQQSWEWTFELMKMIGPNNTMGVGFGNEVDVDGDRHFFSKDGPLIQKIKASVADMDKAGFQDVPITTVFTAGVISSIHGMARPFLQQAHEEFGDRWVFSFNPYSIWDASLMNNAESGDCEGATAHAVSVQYIQDMTKGIRNGITDLIGNNDFKLWLTEAGWSSPGVQTQGQRSVSESCPAWASKESLWTMYKNVMEWDLKFDDGTVAANHIFYFTLRDARGESFGLVPHCGASDCKIQGDDSKTDAFALV